MIRLLRTIGISLERPGNVRLPNCRENQINEDSSSTKKLKLQPDCQVVIHAGTVCKPDSAIRSAGILFSWHLGTTFFQSLPLR